MFIGHFGLALSAKAVSPRTSLGTLMLAAGFVDVLWPLFVLLGWEQVRIDPGNTAVTPLDFEHYPYTHSMLMSIVWGGLFAAVYLGLTRHARGALVVGLLVVSHWVLDFVSHRPDLPLLPAEGPLFGLGLWNNVTATLIVEGAIFFAGVWTYLRVTRAKNRIGRWGFLSLIAVLSVIYVANIFGPPPPSELAVAIVGLVGSLFFVRPYWVDRHRGVVST